MEVMTVINLKLRWVDGGGGRTKGDRETRGREMGRGGRERQRERPTEALVTEGRQKKKIVFQKNASGKKNG